jgi:hypothetical protein
MKRRVSSLLVCENVTKSGVTQGTFQYPPTAVENMSSAVYTFQITIRAKDQVLYSIRQRRFH